MTLVSIRNLPVSEVLASNYMHRLIDKFFKILPMVENSEQSVNIYMESLQFELEGYKELFTDDTADPMVLSLLSILQWLRDNSFNDKLPYKKVRREVFHAISLCKKLEEYYLGIEKEQEV